MKLISMTDFVLEQDRKWTAETDAMTHLIIIISYAQFLKQSLKLEMFVPCDEDGNVLEAPNETDFLYHDSTLNHVDFSAEYERYAKAKEKVLFEDCEVKEIKSSPNYFVVYHKSRQIWISWTDRVIEDFILNRTYLNGLELTESAIKQIGL